MIPNNLEKKRSKEKLAYLTRYDNLHDIYGFFFRDGLKKFAFRFKRSFPKNIILKIEWNYFFYDQMTKFVILFRSQLIKFAIYLWRGRGNFFFFFFLSDQE